jgi:hypothetical protein
MSEQSSGGDGVVSSSLARLYAQGYPERSDLCALLLILLLIQTIVLSAFTGWLLVPGETVGLVDGDDRKAVTRTFELRVVYR